MMAVANNAQTDAELAHMEVVFSFTEVAGVLKGERFAAGARNLFDTFATKGSDGVARVGSNGFLRLAMQSKLAPKYMSNMDVLRCVEMAKFLARMEQDKLEREHKLAQMRRAAAPRQVSAQTDASSASEQAEIATRLHESRKKHFDKRRDKYQAMGLVDEKTGQAFFKPRLVSKPPVRGGVASTPFVAADHMDEKDEAIHRSHRNSIGDECDSEHGEWRNRFEKLHAEATSQQARKAARERATVIAHKRLAAAPKASNRTKRVFARKLTLELRDAFVKSCIAAGNDRGDTLSRAQTKSFLESLIGLVPAAQQRTKADQDLIESVLGIISNGGGAKEIDEPSFTQFARAVALHDPVATRSLKRLDPAEEVLRDFRLRLMAQRKFAQALRQKANAEAAAAVRPSFAPSLCPHSRELDDRRKSRDAAALTREQDLLQRTDKVQRAIEEKRKASLASAAEDKECTFRPKISPHNPHYPVPLPRAHRLCQRQHHHHLHHHHEDSDETEEDDVESKTESDFDRRSIRSRTSGASRRPVDTKGLASQQMARPFTYSSMAAERQKKYNKPHWVPAAKPQEPSFKQEKSHALATNADEENSTEENETMSVCSAQSGESDELLFYADVQVRKHVHRIPVYENDDLRKVAARFSALHGLNVRVEQALFTHLTSLIESFP
ncbi:Hypothetical Protein FCC1311_016262 [Hondaea fermentalgiana]|uniref:Uncharacterized protein n=1 Tax=Hondaea fermentalgiana TaxID=2315210 RepID=A0A2R5G6I7_9STRA|nr:Hypothetical Protein FCC1311_016262 [Hondaea fermentalgiana]|eukprot:GBG25408.1 Hypothetical Protein FCC1311_016262 [Hondaea fermentalgiana]